MSNIAIIVQDDEGLFIRRGSWKYRPPSATEAGGLVKGKTVRAWTQSYPDISTITVDTPRGRYHWNRVE